MPRKERAARPSRAEAFFAWLRQNYNFADRKRLSSPFGSWEVDKFEPWVPENATSRRTDRRRKRHLAIEGCDQILAERIFVIRDAAYQATLTAVSQVEELFSRRIEKTRHSLRADKARAIASDLRNFVSGHVQDQPALGVRGDDYRILNEPQIMRYAEAGTSNTPGQDWEQILRHSLPLIRALELFAKDRDELVGLPPSDNSDILGLVFVGCIRQAAEEVFEASISGKNIERFALATWRDMHLPFPEDRTKQASDEAWIEKKFSAFSKLAPRKKRAIGC